MNHLVAIAFLGLTALTAIAVTPDELYQKEYWQIESAPGEVRWVEIHNISEARQSGIAHISVISRAKNAESWDVKRTIPHLAITTVALCSSVTKPIKVRPVYPEAFNEGFDRWKKENEERKAFVCTTSISDYLATKK